MCQKEFAPRAIKYLDGSWPAENMKRLAEIGVLGMSIPEEYGGSGMSTLDAVLLLEENQGMRWKAADMMIQIEAGRGLLYRAAVSGKQFPDPTLGAMAKIYCNEMSIRVTSEAVQVHGGYGFTDEFPVSRFFRDTRYGSLGGGTTETLRNLVSRKLVDQMDLASGVLGLGYF